MVNRIVAHGEESPAALVANPENWRKHPKAQRAALGGILSEVGWVQSVIVNQRTGRLVDGHLRVEVAAANGEDMVPVAYVDLSENEERAILATLDPLGAMADKDREQLSAVLESIESDDSLGAVLSAVAAKNGVEYSIREVAPPTAKKTSDEELADLLKKWEVKTGDLWSVGRHRVKCGDSTDPEAVAALLDGKRPGMMVTDPPYGVSYDATQRPSSSHGKVTNDDRASWGEAWEHSPAKVAYVWHASALVSATADALKASGYEMRAHIIWRKPFLIRGRGHYHYQHESCFYAVRKGASAGWRGDRTQSTVWDIDHNQPIDEKTPHSTEKPVECMERPIRNHSGDVYDPFLGSGTTLIAAERQNRTCYGLEIEPRYVALILDRCLSAGLEVKRG